MSAISGLHERRAFTKTPRVEIQTATFDLQPRHAFRIARTRTQPLRNVFLRLAHDGAHGLGEASPNAYYRETAEGVLEKIAAAAGWLRSLQISGPADLDRAWTESWEHVAPSRAAQCAIDLALWDWFARRENVSVADLALGAPPRPVATFCTIGLSTPEELRAKVREVRGFPRIKIKSDAGADLAPIHYVRARTTGLLAVDANGAWAGADVSALTSELARLEVAFLEQPLPPAKDAQVARLRSHLPVFADESCVTEDDLPRLAKKFAGINLKLVKCGGLTPALRMARRGRELGLKTMIGCMLESSALIAAGCVAAQLTDYADLDGAWLLANDPVAGWRFERGVLQPPATTGLGVEPHRGALGFA